MKSVQSNQREHRNSKEHEQVSVMHVVSLKRKNRAKEKIDLQALRDFLIKE